MNILDALIIILLGYNTFVGLKLGAIKMLSSIFSIAISFNLTKKFSPTLGKKAQEILEINSNYTELIHFGLLFVILYVLIQAIFHITHHILKWSGVGIANYILGAVIGLGRGTLFCTMIIIPLTLLKSDLAQNSLLIYDAKPLIDVLVIKLKNIEYFNTLLKQLSLPTNPFST